VSRAEGSDVKPKLRENGGREPQVIRQQGFPNEDSVLELCLTFSMSLDILIWRAQPPCGRRRMTERETMTQADERGAHSSVHDVALIVGGGPGISSSCARLFAENGMRVAIAARDPDKPVLQSLEKTHGARRYACDASEPADVGLLFRSVVGDLGSPTLLVHNIDGRVAGIFRKGITEADPSMAFGTLKNSAFSAFLVGQQAARLMQENPLNANGARGTIIFTNASAALKGFAASGAFAMACQAKSGLAQSMARELAPRGIHVANVPIDAAIGWTQEDGSRAHRLAGTAVDDNMADPERIAEMYLQLHRQHRSTWAFEVVLRPWVERW
jgi:NAD(P)-dependent dehydrogenase (short-subunit alcohol dehydrogenase family)